MASVGNTMDFIILKFILLLRCVWGQSNGHCGSPNSAEAARSPQRMKELHGVSMEKRKEFLKKKKCTLVHGPQT